MFDAFTNTWKIPELRRRILFTLGIVVIARIGANIPCPGVDSTPLNRFMAEIQQQSGGSIFALADMFTGGALQQCAVFALGVMPYITASIIMMMLSAVIPSLERLKQEGESGRAKIIQYGRYLTIAVCVFQGFFLAKAFEHPGKLFRGFTGTLVAHPGLAFELSTVLTITCGTILLMWLGEQITERGIGNGVSIIITVGIVQRLPSAIGSAWTMFFPGGGAQSEFNVLHAILLLVMAVAVVSGVIALTQARRRIPVQYAKRMVGRKMLAGGQQFMPLPLNYSGVMPIIFAQAMLMFPAQIFNMFESKYIQALARALTPGELPHLCMYGGLIMLFSYFWVAIQFNPLEIADNLKKYGGYVPGIRPGKPTAEFLNGVMTRITLSGATFLTIIAVIPDVLAGSLRIPYVTASFFGGTSLLITVAVMLDTMRQVESHLIMRHYDGFLRRGRMRGSRR
ncbi:preprotein translocase subunit SecY [bacterium]|nr:preprotein translocase subunit SecY [bacterium]